MKREQGNPNQQEREQGNLDLGQGKMKREQGSLDLGQSNPAQQKREQSQRNRRLLGLAASLVAVAVVFGLSIRDQRTARVSSLNAGDLPSEDPLSSHNTVDLASEGPLARFNAYTFQEQGMETVNWLYIGFAPRMNDPERVRVIISKSGLTARVFMQLNDQDLADYPAYLVRRAQGIKAQIAAVNRRGSMRLNIAQSRRYQSFLARVDEIERAGLRTADQGYNLLSTFFPKNVRRFRAANGEWVTEGHFVYPITIHREALSVPIEQAIPQAKVYRPFAVEERRSAHYDYDDSDGDGRPTRTGVKDHLFGGFPAFWLDPTGKSVGLHGPIRYSSVDEPNGLSQPRFINDPLYTEEINPRIRFDVVRTANSAGCFRAEPMEIRHLLPSRQDQVRRVAFSVIDDFDRIGDRIVDVDYYVVNHAVPQNQRAWYRRHLLRFEEKQRARVEPEAVAEILRQRMQSLMVFPYLSPSVVEFRYETIDAQGVWTPHPAPTIMSIFNRVGLAPAQTSSARP